MSRKFVAGSSQGLYNDTDIVGGYPFSVAGWARADALSPAPWLIFIGSNLATNINWGIFINSGPTCLTLRARNTTIQGISTGGLLVTNRWFHFAGVWASDTERYVWLDGGWRGGSTGLTSVLYNSVTSVSLGYGRTSAPSAYFPGSLSDVAVWKVALRDEEVLRLARGASPLSIRQYNIVDYWPLQGLWSPEITMCPGGGHPLTLLNAPTYDADRPIIYKPRGRIAA